MDMVWVHFMLLSEQKHLEKQGFVNISTRIRTNFSVYAPVSEHLHKIPFLHTYKHTHIVQNY